MIRSPFIYIENLGQEMGRFFLHCCRELKQASGRACDYLRFLSCQDRCSGRDMTAVNHTMPLTGAQVDVTMTSLPWQVARSQSGELKWIQLFAIWFKTAPTLPTLKTGTGGDLSRYLCCLREHRKYIVSPTWDLLKKLPSHEYHARMSAYSGTISCGKGSWPAFDGKHPPFFCDTNRT